MKKYIIQAFCVMIGLTLLSSCAKSPELTVLGVINFPQTFQSSANTVTITADNDSVEKIDFNWQPVNYGIEAAVSYSLQFDLPSDTAGASGWGKAQEVIVGDDLLTKSIMYYELNKIAINGLGLEPGIAAKMVVRAKSYVDRNAYSNAITLDVTPWVAPVVVIPYPSLWVPGDYQGWNPVTAPSIVSVDSSGLYEGYINIPAGGTFKFKYITKPAVTDKAYGDGGNGSMIEGNYDVVNFTVPSAGYYELSANTKTMKWTATKTTWSIIGDATPGGWTTDTQMEYDAMNMVWTVTANMKVAGSFKFRANNAWKIDFGIDAEGNIQYADNPLYPYNGTLMNLTVPSDGNYTITLDLHMPGQYSYKLKKN